MIVSIQPERQALYSDLLMGDILLEVAGKIVADVPDLRQVLATLGERVPVKLVRGGKILTLEVATIIAED
jgi:S1-C subfamily serine protease